MSFWELVFAFGCALFIDRAFAFLLRRLGTMLANRAWDRLTRDPRPAAVAEHWPSCFLCGHGVGCPVGRQCRSETHAHPECLDDIDQQPGADTCVGPKPNA